MQAVYLTEPGRFALREIADPEIRAPYEVRLKMQAVGICGSDLHYYRTGRIGNAVLGDPWIIGHECAGVVESIGAEVKGLAPGDRVAVDPLIACGNCDQCRSGRVNTCRRQHFLGSPGQQQGCMCQLLVMPAACCVPVSPELSVGAAVMVEPLAIALHAQRLYGSVEGKAIGILGAGPIGLCMLGVARLAGAEATAITERLPERLEMARGLGATSLHRVGRSDVVREILALHPAGLDAVFECTGEQSAIDQAAEMLAPGGALMILGIPEIDRISFEMSVIRRKELRLGNVRRQNGCTEDAVAILGSKRLALDPIITHHFDARESQHAFDVAANYREGVGKALVHFDR